MSGGKTRHSHKAPLDSHETFSQKELQISALNSHHFGYSSTMAPRPSHAFFAQGALVHIVGHPRRHRRHGKTQLFPWTNLKGHIDLPAKMPVATKVLEGFPGFPTKNVFDLKFYNSSPLEKLPSTFHPIGKDHLPTTMAFRGYVDPTHQWLFCFPVFWGEWFFCEPIQKITYTRIYLKIQITTSDIFLFMFPPGSLT